MGFLSVLNLFAGLSLWCDFVCCTIHLHYFGGEYSVQEVSYVPSVLDLSGFPCLPDLVDNFSDHGT